LFLSISGISETMKKLRSEGVLEAMASGKPAIVSSLPGPSQLIEDGTDGLIARVR